jgi:CHAD domain-containing protein
MNKAKHRSRLKIGSALAALATEECRSLQQALTERKELHEGIHDARRSCRRLRSLLSFLAPFGDTQQTEELDQALRQLVHGFADLRDAHMATHTARLLADSHATTLTPAVIDLLQTRARVVLEAALEQDPGWQERRSKAERIAAAVKALKWQNVTPSSAKKVLRHSVKRMKKARRTALEQRTDDAFHRWRRRARQVRYELQTLRKARRMTGIKKSYTHHYGTRIKQLGLITDRLGWRQDFQVFLATLEQLPPSPEVLALREALSKKSTAIAKASPVKARNDGADDKASTH